MLKKRMDEKGLTNLEFIYFCDFIILKNEEKVKIAFIKKKK